MRALIIFSIVFTSFTSYGQPVKASLSYFSEKPEKYYFTYDNSRSEIENFSSGYVDTFSILKIKFKLFSNPDSTSDLELDVWKNGRWQTNLKIPYGTNGYSVKADINEDGFNDFQNSLLRGSEVYLFDKTQMRFSRQPIHLAFEWCMIHKKQKLYSNNYESHDVYETDLFRLDGLKQTFYYTAPIDYKVEKNEETATLRLYKISNNNLSDTIFIAQKVFDLLKGDFDYKKFWTDFIRKKGYR